MRKFLLKLGRLTIIAASVYIGAVFLVPALFKKERTLPSVYKKNLDKCRILIVGDSRADRQLNPGVFYAKTNLNTINIAASAWDIYAMSKCLLASHIESKILVISASFFQCNDGAIDMGYLGLESFEDVSFYEKIKLYRFRPEALLINQTRLFKETISTQNRMLYGGNYQREINSGYNPSACSGFTFNKHVLSRNPWYKSPDVNGVKKNLLAKALCNLSGLKDCKIFIYNGPVSDVFFEVANKEGVVQLEKSYDDFMEKECRKYNFIYHSFLNDSSLRDSKYYYDSQHLCEPGATIFSDKVVGLLYENKLVLN